MPLLVNCYINFHILNDQSYYHILDCNESFLIFYSKSFTKICKTFLLYCSRDKACFLLLFSKESINHKYYRSFTFILGAVILIFLNYLLHFQVKFLNFQLSIISLILIILFQYFILYRKIRFR